MFYLKGVSRLPAYPWKRGAVRTFDRRDVDRVIGGMQHVGTDMAIAKVDNSAGFGAVNAVKDGGAAESTVWTDAAREARFVTGMLSLKFHRPMIVGERMSCQSGAVDIGRKWVTIGVEGRIGSELAVDALAKMVAVARPDASGELKSVEHGLKPTELAVELTRIESTPNPLEEDWTVVHDDRPRYEALNTSGRLYGGATCKELEWAARIHFADFFRSRSGRTPNNLATSMLEVQFKNDGRLGDRLLTEVRVCSLRDSSAVLEAQLLASRGSLGQQLVTIAVGKLVVCHLDDEWHKVSHGLS